MCLTVMHFLGGENFFFGVPDASAAARLEADRETLKYTQTTSIHYDRCKS